MNVALWIVQALLAALFVFSGAMKFIMPIEEMTKQMPSMPGWFLRFIGICEILGGLGLILPGLIRVRPGLTPLAAAGLVVIMVGATVISLMIGPAVVALMPLVVGLLAAFVAWGRWRAVPHRGRGAVDRMAARSTS
ncbi:MAG TPA: DoxX family protein [Methylomirabilota bacterium]|nr:DoxX family protein [Methylomirabilota bacterium]